MSYCINLDCSHPHNPAHHTFCQSCGATLRLKDRYRTVKLLGESSNCRTFLAVDEDQPFQPKCILKQFSVPHLKANDSTQLQQITPLYQGISELAHLSQHSEIPTVWASFQQENAHYLVQEYIPGQNLAEVLVQQGQFSEADIYQLLQDVLPTLESVHEHHRVHGGIKPENIIDQKSQTTEVNQRRFRLVDFDLRSDLNPPLDWEQGMSGSAEYVAPEQLRDQTQLNSDFYSLGVTCLHLLTQVSAFDLYDAKSETWVWPDYVKHSVSPHLGYVLDRMVNRNPLERYQSAEEILQDLRSPSRTLSVATSDSSQKLLTLMGAFTLGALAWFLSTLFPIPQPRPVSRLPQPPQQSPTLQNPRLQPDLDRWQNDRSFSHRLQIPNMKMLTFREGPVWAIAVHPDGRSLALGKTDGQVDIVDLRTGNTVYGFKGSSSGPVGAIAISPQGRFLAIGGSDNTLTLWNLRNNRPSKMLKGHSGWVYDVAFSPDGKILASVSRDKTIRLWDVESGKEIGRLRGQAKDIQSLAFSPDRQLLVTGSGEGRVELWDWQAQRLIRSIPAHAQAVWSVAISPDGQTLATGSWDHSVKLWDLDQLRSEYFYSLPQRTLIGHHDKVSSLVFSPRGDTLASGDFQGKVKLWSAETGELRGTLNGHRSWVDLQFHPHQNLLLSGSLDKTIRAWKLSRD